MSTRSTVELESNKNLLSYFRPLRFPQAVLSVPDPESGLSGVV